MKKIEIYDVRIGDLVTWVSAAGTIKGKVNKITMGQTAAGDYVPWYTIDSGEYKSNLCGRGSYLNMMEFQNISASSR